MNVDSIIEVLNIVKKYKKSSYLSAEHDIIYLPLDEDDVPEESEDGKELDALGCHLSEYGWALFT